MEKIITIVKNGYMKLIIYDFNSKEYFGTPTHSFTSFYYYLEFCAKRKIIRFIRTHKIKYTETFYENNTELFLKYDLNVYFYLLEFYIPFNSSLPRKKKLSLCETKKSDYNAEQIRILLILTELKKKIRSAVGKDPTNMIFSICNFNFIFLIIKN